MNTDRLFIALSIPDPAKEQIARTMDGWKPRLPFHKWVHPDDYHITLVFLGETPPALTASVARSITDIAGNHPVPHLSIERVDTFGDPLFPRVLWANMSGSGVNRLSLLQSDVSAAMEKLGFAVEKRPYRPHLTLARKYTGPIPFDPDLAKQIDFSLPTFQASEVVLYRTHMNQTPMYEKLVRNHLSMNMSD